MLLLICQLQLIDAVILTYRTIIVYTINTMKNITLSAPEELIEQARKKATLNGTTLNNEFREWLRSQSTSGKTRSDKYKQLLNSLKYVDAGKKFTREEMNER